MRYLLTALLILFCAITPARASVSVDIGINVPVYPPLVPVPAFPVYYAPSVTANYFFYDGLFWVYAGDNWYASTWYNGPWTVEGPVAVPLPLLRIPVRYYRQPPAYFHGWKAEEPPHWGEHWGRTFEARRPDWEKWDPHSVSKAAPLPEYQKKYAKARYPRVVEKQHAIRREHYKDYQPREEVSQRHFGGGREAVVSHGVPGQAAEKHEALGHEGGGPAKAEGGGGGGGGHRH